MRSAVEGFPESLGWQTWGDGEAFAAEEPFELGGRNKTLKTEVVQRSATSPPQGDPVDQKVAVIAVPKLNLCVSTARTASASGSELHVGSSRNDGGRPPPAADKRK